MKPRAESKQVLVVEDEESLRRAILERLDMEGLRGLAAIDGKDGLQKALKKQPDLILLDILMPKMDGLQMLEQLRRDDWGKQAAVIMLTNIDDPSMVAKARQFGVLDYWVKANNSLDALVNKIGTIL